MVHKPSVTTIGQRIRAAREAHFYSRQWVADKAELSLRAVQDLECDKGSTLNTLERVAKVLGLVVDLVTPGEKQHRQALLDALAKARVF